MPRAIAPVVLTALLLFAQHGALSHLVEHIQDERPQHSQHRNDGNKGSAPGLCVFHIAFGTVLGAIGTTPLTPKFATNAAERSGSFTAHAFPHFAVVPASRGPPVLH
jgi:hypothetical protein